MATVSINSPVIATAKGMSGGGAVSGGSTYAANFFSANLPAGYTSVSPTATVTLNGTTITAAVSFSTTVSTYFMGILGYPNITIASSSTASYSLPTYINFYLMLDVSGSMSFPSTAAEQARLMAVNPDNLQGKPWLSTGAASLPAISPRRGLAGKARQAIPIRVRFPP